MDGTAELRQLANLSRVAAEAARNIAMVRPSDAEAILLIAHEYIELAARLDMIASVRRSGSSPAGT